MLKKLNIIALIITFLTLIQTSGAEKVSVAINFDPPHLAHGQRGLLNITVKGASNPKEPTLPTVDGLIIRPLSTQQSIQMNNNDVSTSITFSYTVSPQKTGEFTLPNFEWTIDDKKYTVTSPTSKLIVGEKSESSEPDIPLELKVNLSPENYYVGQMIPIQIIFSKPITTLTNPRALQLLNENDFATPGLLTPPTTDIVKENNTDKQIITFNTYITPLKSGEKNLSYEMLLQIQKTKPNTSKPHMNSLFDSVFGNMIINNLEEIQLTSTPTPLQILPLPENGKPENFSGAIGQFTIESLTATPQDAQVGDPITLKMIIKGSGNLDRISTPPLHLNNNWKTYKPKSTSETEDPYNATGKKIFEYIIIPQNDQITQTPTIAFNFFNPKTGHYTELKSNPINLKITHSTQPPITQNGQPTKNTPPTSPHQPNEILPIKPEITHSTKTLLSPIGYPFFTPTLLIAALLIGMLLFALKKYNLKNKNNTTYQKHLNKEKNIQDLFQKTHKAFNQKNAKEFYHSASLTILEIISKDHEKSSHLLTIEDVINHSNKLNLNKESIENLKTIFNLADLLKFSGVNNEIKLNSNEIKKFEYLVNELERHKSWINYSFPS